MLKDVICKLDYSNFEEIALVIFGISFLAMCWGALRLRKDIANRFSHIPIDDLVPVEVVRPSTSSNASSVHSAPKGF